MWEQAFTAPPSLDLWQWICGVPKSVFAKAVFRFRRDIVVRDSTMATVCRLVDDEQNLSASMGMEDVKKIFRGGVDPSTYCTEEILEFESKWGEQHSGVLENIEGDLRSTGRRTDRSIMTVIPGKRAPDGRIEPPFAATADPPEEAQSCPMRATCP